MSGPHLTDDQLDPIWQTVPVGTPVITTSGTQLGTVEEKRDNGLIVRGDDASGETYLVTPQDIARVEADGVHLLIGSDQAIRDQAPPSGTEAELPPGTPS
jgi:hypothetical protein